MEILLWFTKNILPAATAIITIFGVSASYIVKTDFDLIFEEKQTKFFTKSLKIFLSTIVIYVAFLFGAIAFSITLQSIPWLASPSIHLIMNGILLVSILVSLLYLVLTGLRGLVKSKLITKILTFVTKEIGFYLYMTIFISSMYIQSKNWLSLFESLSIDLVNNPNTFSNWSKFLTDVEKSLANEQTSELVIDLFRIPLILIIFVCAIMYLHNLNQGTLKKYLYAMEIIKYDGIKIYNKNKVPGLLHLYTRKKNEWVFVKKDDLKDKKVLYLYEKDNDKWYKFTKIEVQD
ncbi:hypothetical protein FORC13_1351 [Bacillus cereus]|uniref:hypothetical protein n=1 Tax=Bacillus cereus TaxID=1396 RepID=UPI000744901D|nr:hypothetical protein [Bacillus cereus]ALZ60412.1 hypothetical protein FORC13_1351 [Bacillus cereus]